ncbi:MAG: lipopolysaccharide biosynthesis protein [Prolixibacteraceae bacterium]|jgi:O-antigen/teichoic acid export membrane protein|nr:MAG: Teichuronic acid biosynthesis protein TuaB [Bacteroidetes bacterium ADurb.Bin123]HPI35452.1 lipopolysaccharide biosynthesis protein [Prolixibacteraceae bacterium]HPL44701.1 lipopolysaccharide biosynthesis protein [Prolixibacteraceae bacterium]HPV18880.1 lipopolysaccharide biosynthesis protein [Prolixibacteraceae bacterium]
MVDLRQKTITGVMWSGIDSFAEQLVHFIVGIVMARVIAPREYGLIGMITVFIAISNSFILSGLGSALIRKTDCKQVDFSTVFYYNLGMGCILYLILFFSAGAIADFFKEPLLKPIVRIVGIDLIIRSLTIIQRITLVKRIDFKLLAKITIISSILSGIIGIVMAYRGYEVWSLVARMISFSFITSLLLWILNRWRPTIEFSRKSFKELFGFGNKIMISGIFDTVYRNIYYLVIGKFFSANELGYYTRAQTFNDLPSKQITSVISRVTFPILSEMRENPVVLKGGYKRMITSTTYISFVILAGLAAIAEPMVITLIGEAWRPSIVYLQMLCFVGMLYPLQALNLNILQVQGRSDLYLRIEIIKKLLAVPIIIVGIIWGIKVMLVGMMVNSLISYYINSYWSGKMINYSMSEQITDILPSFLVAIGSGLLVFVIGKLIPGGYLMKMISQLLFGAVIVFFVSELFKLAPYLYLKEIVLSRFNSIRTARNSSI